MARFSPRISRLRWKLAASATATTVAALLVILVFSELAVAVSHRSALRQPAMALAVQRETADLARHLSPFLGDPTRQRPVLRTWFFSGTPDPGGLRLAGPGLPAPGISVSWMATVDSTGKLLAVVPEGARGAVSEAWGELEPGRLRDPATVGFSYRNDSGDTIAAAGFGAPGDPGGYLFLEAATAPAPLSTFSRRMLKGLPGTLLTLLPFGAVVGLFLGLAISRGLVRRLGRLGTVAAAWSRGELGLRADDESRDELGELARDLGEMAGQLKTLMDTRQELAATQERNRLARELHDTVKQQTFSVSLFLASVDSLIDVDPQAAHAKLSEARKILRRAGQDLEELILALRPAALQGQGLAAALREMGTEWSRRQGVPCEVRLLGEANLAPELEQTLLRVAQEALTNVSRHAEASQAELLLEVRREPDGAASGIPLCGNSPLAVKLIIQDDGRGFDPTARPATGFGLRSMQERIAAVDGVLTLESAPGQGTRVVAQLPIQLKE